WTQVAPSCSYLYSDLQRCFLRTWRIRDRASRVPSTDETCDRACGPSVDWWTGCGNPRGRTAAALVFSSHYCFARSGHLVRWTAMHDETCFGLDRLGVGEPARIGVGAGMKPAPTRSRIS